MQIASTSAYGENRGRFPLEELRKFDGKWVAFSADGQRVVASAPTITELANQVRTAKSNLHEVVLERIELDTDEIYLGGAELL